jgi:hypothetical protein
LLVRALGFALGFAFDFGRSKSASACLALPLPVTKLLTRPIAQASIDTLRDPPAK